MRDEEGGEEGMEGVWNMRKEGGRGWREGQEGGCNGRWKGSWGTMCGS